MVVWRNVYHLQGNSELMSAVARGLQGLYVVAAGRTRTCTILRARRMALRRTRRRPLCGISCVANMIVTTSYEFSSPNDSALPLMNLASWRRNRA